METYQDITTAIGTLRVFASSFGLTNLFLMDENEGMPGSNKLSPTIFKETESQLERYFEGELKKFDLPLDWSGLPPFRQRVLKETAQIPWGELITYGELAMRAGSMRAARAAGGALAHNPFLIVVPCHRVIGSDGALHGFSAQGGLKLKQKLLELEGHKVHNNRIVQKKEVDLGKRKQRL
ncbi:MAG: methylated-DNA--[protein]-cysteine S-methyltransferase [Anaerolineaceae bacterium]|nr:methylated-DNA--[protein]-cysteine S-methyltransferase [Anaerolineaceae bacterium]